MMKLLKQGVVGIAIVLLPSLAFAQGAISGLVRDTTGAVLPGVTVEAASPALIEKTRSVVTDSQGQYKILDLRPGTYSVTFTLPGFSTIVREGLQLTAAANLPVNADMKVGAIEETLTVTGATPVVDVQSTRQQAVMSRDVLDAIPRSRDAALTAGLLVGVTAGGVQDMGGSGGQVIAQLVAHGGDGNDQIWNIDGMKAAGNTRRVLVVADQSSQEVTYEVSGISAETPSGGVRLNTVPREGGNKFSGQFFAAYTNHGMTTNNLSDEITAKGVTSVPTITKIYDYSPSFGGPIKRDKLWFYTTYRKNGSNGTYANVFFDSDPTRPGPNPNILWDVSTRLTFQATPRNKFSGFVDKQFRSQPYRTSSPTQSPEASAGTRYPSMYVAQTKWTAPITSKLLTEFAASYYHEIQTFVPSPSWPGPSVYPEFEISTGKYTKAAPASGGLLNPNTYNPMIYTNLVGSVAYVTGSHAFKVGWSDYYGTSVTVRPDWLPTLRFSNGQPLQVQLTALPSASFPRLNYEMGMYAQDQWTMKRFTINLGVRVDLLNEQLDEQNAPAGAFVGPRHSDKIANMPNWKDISPRLGVAWDVFGNGKTAVKASLSRYLKQEIAGFAGAVNPIAAATDTRGWTDANSDRKPQVTELGPSTNLNFGLPAVTTQPTDDVREGWQKRVYNWEFSTGIQHTLVPGFAVGASYFHRKFGNLTYTRNTLISPADFTEFTIANPLDPSERIKMYNLSATKRGQSLNVIDFAPDDWIAFNGLDLTVSGRFGKGGVVNGGVAMGKTDSDICTLGNTVDPNNLRFCQSRPKFLAQNAYKLIFSYPLPYDVKVSATYQNVPGPVFAVPPFPAQPGIAANYTVTSAIAGIPLTNTTITTKLLPVGQQFGERKNQVDLRLNKSFTVQKLRISPMIDFYNLFNANTILSENFTYGPIWRQPTDVLIGRVIQIGAQLSF
jgi:hypothetical protein